MSNRVKGPVSFWTKNSFFISITHKKCRGFGYRSWLSGSYSQFIYLLNLWLPILCLYSMIYSPFLRYTLSKWISFTDFEELLVVERIEIRSEPCFMKLERSPVSLLLLVQHLSSMFPHNLDVTNLPLMFIWILCRRVNT